MNGTVDSTVTRRCLPLILIRGYGGLGVGDEKRIAYQGFNDGTVYPHKRGPNYIYEGLILRLMKSDWQYQDATNVVGYYGKPVLDRPRAEDLPPELRSLTDFFGGSADETYPEEEQARFKVVIDPGMAQHLIKTTHDVHRTVWVFRYYDLDDRKFAGYGEALVRLIDFIRALATKRNEDPPKVNIIAHSMGGLIVREAIQNAYPSSKPPRKSVDYINKLVTLGTPHQGISFQLLKKWIILDAEQELERFSPNLQDENTEPFSYHKLKDHFDLVRLLTVVGTNYRTYGVEPASLANRIFSVPGEFGPSYNRSDGLVKQTYAQVPGAPRTFVHKCHGGPDSLVTSREAFEIATRFFFGNFRARLRLVEADITRGRDKFGKSEFFFGVSIKPRKVDFELFHQSAEAENCYGPFKETDLSDEKLAFDWAGDSRLIWEGYLSRSLTGFDEGCLDSSFKDSNDDVFRVEFYVGERDVRGMGHSDTQIFRGQYYIRAVFSENIELYLHSDERFARTNNPERVGKLMDIADGGWEFSIGRQAGGQTEDDPGFYGRFRIELDQVPLDGPPVTFDPSRPETISHSRLPPSS